MKAILILLASPVSWTLSVALPSALTTSFTPTRISFDSLLLPQDNIGSNQNDVFLNALKEVGLVSITDIPSFNKQELFQTLEECVSNYHNQNVLDAPLHIFPDGTRRRTLATRTFAGQAESLFHEDGSSECHDRLEKESEKFRKVVNEVTTAIASSLNGLFADTDHEEGYKSPPILDDVSGEFSYSVQQVINDGEHLEHFHCYYSPEGNSEQDLEATIEWHTDQGLMLAFTPGQRNGEVTSGFYVQLRDGSTAEVEFDLDQDDLIIMIGDGINQYVNPALERNGVRANSLRAVPHSLRLPHQQEVSGNHDSSARIWYGRMVLPPPNSLHPAANITFGDMRTSMISKNPEALSLGCASQNQVARELAEAGHEGNGDEEDTLHCNSETSAHCWHECMNYTDFDDVSPENCEERGLSLGCVNDEGYLWVKEIHNPAFQLGCVNLSVAEFAVVETDENEHGEDGTHSPGDAADMQRFVMAIYSTLLFAVVLVL